MTSKLYVRELEYTNIIIRSLYSLVLSDFFYKDNLIDLMLTSVLLWIIIKCQIHERLWYKHGKETKIKFNKSELFICVFSCMFSLKIQGI